MSTGDKQAFFNYKIVSQFAIVTVLWGIVGMLVGVILAAQLVWPEITFDIPWLSYFCVWWVCLIRDLLLRGAKNVPGSIVL